MGSVAHQITLGRHRIGISMPRVKRAGFVLERDEHPDQRAECLLSPLSARMSPSGSFCGAFCAGLKIVGLSPAKCLAYSSQEEYMSHSIGRPYSSQLECVSHSIHRIVFTGNWGY